MKLVIALLTFSLSVYCQNYPPEAGTAGSTAIHKDSPFYVAWATGITVERGYVNKANPSLVINGSNKASAGEPQYALGYPNGSVVSLGDEGYAILTFDSPIIDDDGFDFAIFENGGPSFLELAFVEVSSDGENFFRFPSHSQTQTQTQIGTFGTPSATYLNNLAGKYAGTYGTPFDLSELEDNPFLNKNNITHVKVIDVVGSIDPQYATYDSYGNAVNESFPTPFNSCGFDLQAVGVIHQQNLSVDEFTKSGITIYPNPASTYFFIDTEEYAVIRIYDISGRLVSKKTHHKNPEMDISGLKTGVYVVEIVLTEKNKKSIQKLVIK